VRGEEYDRRGITFAGGIRADGPRSRDRRADGEGAEAAVVCVGGGPNRGNDHFLAVTFMPEFDLSKGGDLPPPAETVFVLDCSGSMQGESIAQATAALELCLRSLNEGDTFNICRFGSRFEMFRSEPVRYDAAGAARRRCDTSAAARTSAARRILKPLQEIFKNPPVVGSVRNVIVLTDGQVSNEPDVIELARQHRAANRIFSFGIAPPPARTS
jgi:Ca-activated chloride channel family protein